MKAELQAIATIASLVNPAMCGVIFLKNSGQQSVAQRRVSVLKAVLAITTILTIAALVGTRILDIFGVSMDAFACTGGVILAWIGASMMAPPKSDEERKGVEPSLAPLILFAASPGTITGVITVAASHSKHHHSLPISALIAIAASTLILLVVLLVAAQEKKPQKVGLGRQIVTNYLGLIVIAMGAQFALTGFKSFMGL